MGNRLQALLFDLDGTLLDTAPDMAAALNAMLDEHGRESLPFTTIRCQVSHGARGLLHLGFGVTDEHPRYACLRERFLEIYAENLLQRTLPFPGISEVLDFCDANKIHWGVVTNKPGFLTEPLLSHLGLQRRAACVVSGDSLSKRKPDPEPLQHACRLCGTAPSASAYVGDAERDIIAGRAAGMRTLAAVFGYLGAQDTPERWGADALVREPTGIIDWIRQHG